MDYSEFRTFLFEYFLMLSIRPSANFNSADNLPLLCMQLDRVEAFPDCVVLLSLVEVDRCVSANLIEFARDIDSCNHLFEERTHYFVASVLLESSNLRSFL